MTKEKRITPMDYEYDKYFLKNATIIKSALSSFFFFESEESFNREFDKFKSYCDDLVKRAEELKIQKLNEKGGDGKWMMLGF